MDVTIVFVIVLMLLAVQNGMPWLAVALFVVALVASKNKFFIGAALIGGVVAALLYLGVGSIAGWIVAGGLFLAFILVVMQDPGTSGPNSYGQQGYM